MTLSDTAIRNAKASEKQYRMADDKGLTLLIKPNGGKYWRFRYRYGGKEKEFSFGVYPDASLKEAREKRDEARRLLREGIDPSQARQEAKRQVTLETKNSFGSVTREWHENKKAAWTERHANYVLRRIEADLFPALGHRPIASITAPELLTVIRAIENRDAIDIAHRALQTCGQIFRYAIATGMAERDITPDLRGALKTRRPENHPHLAAKELPELLAKLEKYDGELQTKLAFKFLILTFVRTIELRGARWEEIDFEKAEWRIPACQCASKIDPLWASKNDPP